MHVHFEIIAVLANHPERQNINGLILGNSKYHANFGYSSNDSELLNVVQPCTKYKDRIILNDSSLVDVERCKDCLP